MAITAFYRSRTRLDRVPRAWFAASLTVCLVHWLGIMGFLLTRLGTLDFLKLHYTAEFGIDWMGAWYLIFTYPAVGLGILLVNSWMALRLQTSYRSLAILVAVATLGMQVLIAAAGIIAVILNI